MSTIIAILLLQSISLMWIDGNRFAGARSLADSDSDVVDCSEFKDDLDVISRFPFSVAVDPDRFSYGISYVRTYPNESHSIQEIHINHESVVPPSVVCLRNLRELLVDTTPFHKNIVPDQLADMKKLRYFFCYSSPIVQMTPRLSTMTTLEMFECLNCQLKTLPDFSNLRKLWSVGVSYNQMKELRGLQNLRMLDIQANQFEEIPRIANKSSVNFLMLSNNPLKDFYPIWSYPNLEGFQVADTGLKSLPTYIDKLAHLDYIDVSNNKLTHLPRTILNLGKLKEVAIQNNAFSETELQAIRDNFEKYRPFIRLVTEDDSKPSEENSSNKHA